jgi:hypothetical protein
LISTNPPPGGPKGATGDFKVKLYIQYGKDLSSSGWWRAETAVAVFLDCATAASEVDGRRIILNFKRCPGTWIYCNFTKHIKRAKKANLVHQDLSLMQ